MPCKSLDMSIRNRRFEPIARALEPDLPRTGRVGFSHDIRSANKTAFARHPSSQRVKNASHIVWLAAISSYTAVPQGRLHDSRSTRCVNSRLFLTTLLVLCRLPLHWKGS